MSFPFRVIRVFRGLHLYLNCSSLPLAKAFRVPLPTFFAKWIESTREKTGGASDLELLQKTFDRIK